MLPERHIGTLWMHLLNHGLIDQEIAVASATVTDGDYYGEPLALVHVNPRCSLATPSDPGIRIRPATAANLRQAGRAPQLPEPCHVCWLGYPKRANQSGTRQVPALMRHFEPVLDHLHVSAAIDDFFTLPVPARTAYHHQLGMARYLSLCLDALPAVTDPALETVTELLAGQRARLGAWKPPLCERIRGARTTVVDPTWVLILATRTVGDPLPVTEVDQAVWSALGSADHHELVEAAGGQSAVLARVPASCVTLHTQWDTAPTLRLLYPLTSRAEEFGAHSMRAALALGTPGGPFADDFLDSLAAAMSADSTTRR